MAAVLLACSDDQGCLGDTGTGIDRVARAVAEAVGGMETEEGWPLRRGATLSTACNRFFIDLFSVDSEFRDRPLAGLGMPAFPWSGKAGEQAAFAPREHR